MLGSLRSLLDAEQPRLLSPERALAILGALSDTLFPVHAAGDAHGAFGPETILVDPGDPADTVELTDDAPGATYLAPEIRDGGEPTPAVDAYAYAALAHLLLAGDEPAFEGDGTPLPVAALHPGFPAFAGEAIARGLQKDPAARPLPKVLFTLLRVVPADRWPAASQPEPEPVVEEAVVEEPAAEEVAIEEVAQPSPDPLEHHEWHAAFAPVQDVPSIDWRADEDPTRPSNEVPAIDWAHTDEADRTDHAPDVVEAAEVAEVAPEHEHPTDTREQPAVRVDDATFLHDFMDALRAPADVPSIEPLDHAIPEEQLEHRPGRRVRRKSREHSPERLQKVVLVLILMMLLAVGAVWALSHKDGPRYDPKLQGASLVLSQVSPART